MVAAAGLGAVERLVGSVQGGVGLGAQDRQSAADRAANVAASALRDGFGKRLDQPVADEARLLKADQTIA